MEKQEIYLREYKAKKESKIRAFRILVIAGQNGESDTTIIISKKQFQELSEKIEVRESR